MSHDSWTCRGCGSVHEYVAGDCQLEEAAQAKAREEALEAARGSMRDLRVEEEQFLTMVGKKPEQFTRERERIRKLCPHEWKRARIAGPYLACQVCGEIKLDS